MYLHPQGGGGTLAGAGAVGRHAPKVLSDRRLAHEIGISVVPALLVSVGETGYLLSGAQPYEAVRSAVERARRDGQAAA